tara:strand:+ start:803 stop:925 length:123 start_codon:yes stop_codon:yes gene_type:complete
LKEGGLLVARFAVSAVGGRQSDRFMSGGLTAEMTRRARPS